MFHARMYWMLLLAFVMCLAFAPLSVSAEDEPDLYSDISGHWAEEAIVRFSSDFNFLEGKGNGRFCPNDAITRAELATIINRIMLLPKAEKNYFTDTEGKWYETAVNALALQNAYLVTEGDALGDQPLTREEAVRMLYKVFPVTDPYGKETISSWAFTDQSEIKTGYGSEISIFRKLGFISGYPDGSFHPKETFTRAQMVTILDNIIGVYISEPGVYEAPEGSNVCISSPDVTLNGKNIHYVAVVPPANTGLVTLQAEPEFCSLWGNHSHVGKEHLLIIEETSNIGFSATLKVIRLNASEEKVVANQEPPREIDNKFAGGAGTKLDPYIIENEEQLRRIGQYLSRSYSGYYFLLGKDITLRSDWTPLGSKAGADGLPVSNDDAFWGVLDGGGHTIKNLNIRYKGDGIALYGLFSFLGGTVQNLSVSGSVTVDYARGNGTAKVSGICVGGIAGAVGMYGGRINNCHADLTLDIKASCGIRAGGIAGNLLIGTISYCSATGSISAESGSFEHDCQAGGIVGRTGGTASSRIVNCDSDVSVTAAGGYYNHAGGIAGGLVNCQMEHCFASGKILAKGASLQNNAGGVAGQMDDSQAFMLKCASAAEVSAFGNPGYFNAVGGLVGSAYTGSTITDCYSTGPVKVSGTAMAGGLVGRAECVITTSYSVSKITENYLFLPTETTGLIGSVRNFIVIRGCGVFNVDKPYFISYDKPSGIDSITPVGDKPLSQKSTYSELGGFTAGSDSAIWDFDNVWTFSNSNGYPYPVLKALSD